MARPSDLLRRFRLMAVPGRAGIAGVPVDRAALLREELAPVFAALRSVEDEVNDVVLRAGVEGEDRRRRASLAARQILVRAHEAEELERMSAARATEAETVTTCAKLQAAADDEVRHLDVESASRVEVVVDELVRRVLATAGESRVPS